MEPSNFTWGDLKSQSQSHSDFEDLCLVMKGSQAMC